MENSYIFNKQIISNCPNYYKIINIDYDKDDKVTEKLLVIYTEFIFSVKELTSEVIKELNSIDSIVYKFLTDHKFKKTLSSELLNMKVKSKVTNVIEYVVQKIIAIYDDYVLNYTREIFLPRWI